MKRSWNAVRVLWRSL